jgi:tRNA (adenine57-N1/adenine58-N1)-methyltransferase
VVLQRGQSFHFHRGIVSHDALIGQPEGTTVRTNTGATLVALRPTLAEYVLKMKRGAQVVYPKDIAMILLQGDVFPGAAVVEAGAGSGALTIGLLRAVGPAGQVTTYELREDFAAVAGANVEAYLGKAENLTIRIGDVYEGIAERAVDRVILDLPEPWRVLGPAAEALRPGGIFVAYLPTILQVAQLVDALRADPAWAMISPFEALVRGWHIDGRSVRPEHRMVAHTGFITTARRIVPLPAPEPAEGLGEEAGTPGEGRPVGPGAGGGERHGPGALPANLPGR